MSTYMIETTQTQLRLTSPYNPEFARLAKANLGARWENRTWCFDLRDRELVLDFIEAKLGWKPGMQMVSVHVKFNEDRHYGQGPCILLGRVIAVAEGRDSGAKLGTRVRLLEGEATSGGSMKNWTTEVREGTEFIVHDVPQQMAQDYVTGKRASRNVEVTLTEPNAPASLDRGTLEHERQALIQRLAEIDTRLG